VPCACAGVGARALRLTPQTRTRARIELSRGVAFCGYLLVKRNGTTDAIKHLNLPFARSGGGGGGMMRDAIDEWGQHGGQRTVHVNSCFRFFLGAFFSFRFGSVVIRRSSLRVFGRCLLLMCVCMGHTYAHTRRGGSGSDERETPNCEWDFLFAGFSVLFCRFRSSNLASMHLSLISHS
jgi:hypothetical protein